MLAGGVIVSASTLAVPTATGSGSSGQSDFPDVELKKTPSKAAKSDRRDREPGRSDDKTRGRTYKDVRVNLAVKPADTPKNTRKTKRARQRTRQAIMLYDTDQVDIDNKKKRTQGEDKVSVKLTFDSTSPAFNPGEAGVEDGVIRAFGQKFDATDGEIKTKIDRDDAPQVTIKAKGDNKNNDVKLSIKAAD